MLLMITTTVHRSIVNIPLVPCDDATLYRTYWNVVYNVNIPVANAVTDATIKQYVGKKAFSL